MAVPRTPRGPADPDRRRRIVAAVLEIVEERGLIGVSHRTVAKQAGVPLGSTTYYFASLDDLLAAALEQVVDEYETRLRASTERLAGKSGRRLAGALTDLVLEYLDDHGRTRAAYALCHAAMDRPGLRPLAARYTQVSVDTLRTVVPHANAVALVAAIDGLLLRGLVAPVPLDRKEVQRALTVIAPD